jgi:DNA-binding response OmpR family regulator
VLIVDDEPDILLMLRLVLEADGYQTALAADGGMVLCWSDEELVAHRQRTADGRA